MNVPLRAQPQSEALVLIPGLAGDATLFSHALARLSRARPVTLALPVGGERVEEIASAILTQMPQRVALVGHGLGGVVALEILRRAPKRVARLALISAMPFPDTPAEAAERDARLIALRAGRIADWVRAEFGGAIPGDAILRGARVARIAEMVETLGTDTVLRQVRALQRRGDYQSAFRRFRQPIHLIAGSADPVCPPRRQQVLSGLAPDARLVRIEEAGHFPMLDAPEAVTEALEAFVEAPLVLR
ncbi:Pimeloyl-ACP methyl ester carboxylesterase [Roseivivax lentus]|uniref:Pimeloyl-ACP methyl ester carboxylesterase n=1 Tax=Roseivivax lentus TaxID=633194 RepID=A0A1N7NZ96_9RHOB|nr:alpha/beta fold hydrolase [Roseivivax lentus]SIT03685.1 Pimeloyl-ACP methyl ester carboxylesterase [Roseivivax lentus]